ncbi:MAG: ribonuclease III [Bryobacteraceae bacterium]|nr:ribonuclease III [Bryobacteraceae bacterium]
MSADLEGLETVLGYKFRDRCILLRALTHKSRLSEKNSSTEADNEQLEFLGDSILGFLVSEALVRTYPGYREGRLSKLKAHLVSAIHLHSIANKLRLGDYLVLGRSEEMSGGRKKKALLANALEAVIAAMYLDGGLEPARRFIEEHLLEEFDSRGVEAVQVRDYKSELQEAAQAMKLPLPRYLIVKEEGPEHAKTFTVEARIGRDLVRQAEGPSKKSAGQLAARLLLEGLRSSTGQQSNDTPDTPTEG